MPFAESGIDPLQFNRAFVSFLDNEEDGMRKMAQAGATFVRDHLREEAAVRRILPPERIDPSNPRVIPSIDSDTLVVRKDLEPRSRAVALTFGTQPEARIVQGSRIDIPFFTISSEMFQIREQHLLAYEMPITRLIEENTGRDIQEIEDLEWLVYSEGAVQNTGRIIRGEQARADATLNAPGAGFRGEIQRPDYVDLINVLPEGGNRKRLEKIWMNDIDYNGLLKWTVEDMGNRYESETMVDGYRHDQVLGKSVIRSVKTDLLQTGNIYGYTRPEFLGFFFVLNNVKFYLDKIANLIRWQAWEDIGISISNISSVAKLELYNGIGTVGVPDDSSDPLPNEEDLFQQTNPADNGGVVFPEVTLS